MPRKDYIAIAGAIVRARAGFEAGTDPFPLVVSALADVLQSDNPRFNRERFIAAACKGE